MDRLPQPGGVARVGLLLVWPVVLGWLLTCGPDGPRDRSTSPDSGSDSTGTANASLEPPDPPVFTHCPPGWREEPPLEAADPITCDPWPAGGRATCPDGEVHLPGEAACRPLGSACPTGLWPADLPSDRPVLYVAAEASAGGDGSRDAPFAQIADALPGAAESGAVIALSRGLFTEDLVLADDLELRGVCAAETRIAAAADGGGGSTVGPPATVTITGTGVVLQDLQIGGSQPGIWLEAEAEATLRGVAVAHAGFAAIVVDGGRLTADGLAATDTELLQLGAAGAGGVGLVALDGAQIDLRHAAFERNIPIGIYVRDLGTRLSMADSVIAGTLGGGLPDFDGTAMASDGAARVEVRRTALEANQGAAFEVQWLDQDLAADAVDDAPALLVEDVVVRGAASPHAHAYSAGLRVSGLAGDVTGSTRVVLRRALLEDLRGEALRVGFAHLTAEDVAIRRVAPYGTQRFGETGGFGLLIGIGGQVDLTRLDVREAHSIAIWVFQASTVSGSELLVRDTRALDCPAPCASYGIGLAAQSPGSAIQLGHFAILANDLAGALVASGAALDLHDGEISHNIIGLSIQDEQFDFSTLASSVLFRDNERNLDTAVLPLPEHDSLPVLGDGDGSLIGGGGEGDRDGGRDVATDGPGDAGGPTCSRACSCCGEQWQVTGPCVDDSPDLCGNCPCGEEDVRHVDAPGVGDVSLGDVTAVEDSPTDQPTTMPSDVPPDVEVEPVDVGTVFGTFHNDTGLTGVYLRVALYASLPAEGMSLAGTDAMSTAEAPDPPFTFQATPGTYYVAAILDQGDKSTPADPGPGDVYVQIDEPIVVAPGASVGPLDLTFE